MYLLPGTPLFRVPDELPDELLGPVNCAMGTVTTGLLRAGAGEGDTVVIMGAGGLGLHATAMAKDMGAHQVIVLDRLDNRLRLAEEFGADATINVEEYAEPAARVQRVRAAHGNRAFSNLNEGLGKVLRFGANSAEVLGRLKWMEQTLAPTLAAALKVLGELELKPLMAQALHMGDEVHNRNIAASALLIKRLVPALLKSGAPPDDVAAVIEFIAGNDHFFLNLSMAACKAMLDAAHGVAASSMVTAMARNGVEFGIRVSGLGERWFTAPAPVVNGLYFPGNTIKDAAPDLGDSAITETAGLGGFAMAAAPAIVKFVGGTPQDALANTLAMTHITLARNGAFTLPALDFAGTPAGIDARRVVDTGILPLINTGIAHKEPGVGQIGAGVTRAPLQCFTQAVMELEACLPTA